MDTFSDDKDESLRSKSTVLPEYTFKGGLIGSNVPSLAISIETKLGLNFST